MAGNPVVLHVVGGCHVNGYPFGASASFVQVALDALGGPEVVVQRQAPVSFRKINAYLEDSAVAIERNVVVLQIGNHESMKYSWRDGARRSEEPAKSTDAGRDEAASSRRSFRSLPFVKFVVQRLKLAVFLARELKGDKFFDEEEFSGHLTDTFARLTERRPAHVIVISSLLADALETNVCRRRLNAVLKSACSSFGFDYIDAYRRLAEEKRRRAAPLFCDALHLNEAGHRVVGRLLAEPLGEALRSAA